MWTVNLLVYLYTCIIILDKDEALSWERRNTRERETGCLTKENTMTLI